MFKIILYYKYVSLTETECEKLIHLTNFICNENNLLGRIRIGKEGINGTLGGNPNAVDIYVDHMKSDERFKNIDWKTSICNELPFSNLQVRLVKEIVSLELPDNECSLANGGKHLSPEAFHKFVLDSTKDSAIIDVRNDYEYKVGHFNKALNPETRRFGQFPEWCRKNEEMLKKKDRVLMYCTGGIRCEKASSYLKHLGIENVYQLQGGIHRYLETFTDGGAFKGKNFVFDERVTMSSDDTTIIGNCSECKEPHDELCGFRCEYCRAHLLLCPNCSSIHEVNFCEEHKSIFVGSLNELQQNYQKYEEELCKVRGREGKGKRRSIRKHMNMLERLIQAYNRVQ